MQSQTSLMLGWRSFSEWGADCVTLFGAYEGCQDVGYA